jgi:type IV fimbrial biogenesis protein FimT
MNSYPIVTFATSRFKRGFTLIELLVTLAIMAIFLSLAFTAFQTMIQNNRVTTEIRGLVTALNYARNTSLSQSVPVAVCPIGSANSTTCGTAWSSGWMVVLDPTGTPSILQSKTAPASNAVLSSTASAVTFDSRGLSTSSSAFKVCDGRGGAFARSAQVFPTGFIQIGNTVGQVAWGTTAITCP